MVYSFLLLLTCGVLCTAATPASSRNVLVTGATGRTGKLLYAQLKAREDIAEVRAFVRASTDAKEKARAALNCTSCDASEGIFYGDVTVPSTLKASMSGVDTVAITVGVGFSLNASVMKAVEFFGVENQVAALATYSNVSMDDKRVVLLSSMETTNPHPLPFEGGPVLFWKLNAEASVGYSGIRSAIVKPCGIEGTYGRGGKQLLVGHDDNLPAGRSGAISREDLAAVMAEVIAERSSNLRFDLCVGKGAPTTDLGALINSARMPWMKE